MRRVPRAGRGCRDDFFTCCGVWKCGCVRWLTSSKSCALNFRRTPESLRPLIHVQVQQRHPFLVQSGASKSFKYRRPAYLAKPRGPPHVLYPGPNPQHHVSSPRNSIPHYSPRLLPHPLPSLPFVRFCALPPPSDPPFFPRRAAALALSATPP